MHEALAVSTLIKVRSNLENKINQYFSIEYILSFRFQDLTGVEIRFHVDSASWIPKKIKSRFLEMVRLIKSNSKILRDEEN